MHILCFALVLALSAILGGCATVVPSFDLPPGPTGSPTLTSIKARIVCELAQIVTEAPYTKYLVGVNDINATVILNLDVTDDGTLAPTFSYLSGGPFTFGAGFTIDRSREQNLQEQMTFSLQDIQKRIVIARNVDHRDLTQCAPLPDTDLAGDLGMKKTFDLSITTDPDLRWDGTGTYGAFGGYVDFISKRELNGTGPTWTLKHFKGPGSFLSASDNINDRLTFAFTKGVKDKSAAAQAAKLAEVQFLNIITQNQLANSLRAISSSLK